MTSADRHMKGECREVVGMHCHCSNEFNMPEGTRRACTVCEPGPKLREWRARLDAMLLPAEPGRIPACGYCGFPHDPDDPSGCGF